MTFFRNWLDSLKENFLRFEDSDHGPIPHPNPFIRYSRYQPGVPGDNDFREMMECVLVVATAIQPLLTHQKVPKVTREKAMQGCSALGLLLGRLQKLRKRAFCKNFAGIFADANLVKVIDKGPLLFEEEKAAVVAKIDEAAKANRKSNFRQSSFRARGQKPKTYSNRGGYRGGFQQSFAQPQPEFYPQFQPQGYYPMPPHPHPQGHFPGQYGQYQGNPRGRGKPWRARGGQQNRGGQRGGK